MTRFTTYDRWGNQTGTLRDIIDAKHDDSWTPSTR